MEKYKGIKEDLKGLLQIQSVLGKPEEGMPFGRETCRALSYMLSLGRSAGFKVKDVDGFAGHIEWGEGEEIFGVLCHLDVVPAGGGWKFPPFSAEEHGGKIYARGAQDDKTPAISVFHAVKRLKEEGFVPSKKFRLILGLNEESGWKCIEHYMQKEKMPSSGFSPDSDFPVINCEKGVLFLRAEFPFDNPQIAALGGGTRLNMVPDTAYYTTRGAERKEFNGLSAHGSQPHKGDNAIHKMIKDMVSNFESASARDIDKFFCRGDSLERINLALSDQRSGKLTLNLGTIELCNGKIICGLDIRFPVSFTREDILSRITAALPESCSVQEVNYHRPLYIPESDPLVKSLLEAYEKVTGEKGYCISIGGATYSRALDKCVAFGPVFPDEESTIHKVDECVSVENIYKMTDIYYEALKALL